jgi:hypothetical protein
VRRRLFTILASGSLVLWLAVSALWLRSYWVSDALSWDHPEGGVTARASRGRLWVRHFHIYHQSARGLSYDRREPETIPTSRPPGADDYFSTPAFTFHAGRLWWSGMSFSDAIAPFWALAAVLATPPLLWLVAGWQRRRRGRVQGFRVEVGARAGDLGRG